MKKRIPFRLFILVLSAAMILIFSFRSRKIFESISARIDAVVVRIDFDKATSSDDTDKWTIYADYEYAGKSFSNVSVKQSSSEPEYKVGDTIKIRVNAEGKFLGYKISSNSGAVWFATYILVFSVFSLILPAMRRGNAQEIGQGKLNYAAVHDELIRDATKWNRSRSSKYSYMLSAVFFAIPAAELVPYVFLMPFLTFDTGKLYFLIPAVICFAFPTFKRITLLKKIEKGCFRIIQNKCVKKERHDWGEDGTRYTLHFEDGEKLWVDAETYHRINDNAPVIMVGFEGDNRHCLMYSMDAGNLDDDLLPFLADAVQ